MRGFPSSLKCMCLLQRLEGISDSQRDERFHGMKVNPTQYLGSLSKVPLNICAAEKPRACLQRKDKIIFCMVLIHTGVSRNATIACCYVCCVGLVVELFLTWEDHDINGEAAPAVGITMIVVSLCTDSASDLSLLSNVNRQVCT